MQIRGFVFGACLLLIAGEAFAAPKTMRLDYYHSGNDKQELFSVDRVVIEPLEWPGNPDKAIDRTNLGKYLFEVRDSERARALLARVCVDLRRVGNDRRGAQTMNRTFHESVRFPAPDGPVTVVIRKRDAQNQFQDAWTAEVDPKSMFVDTSSPPAPGALIAIEKNGDPADKVDVLLLGDGYTAAERGKFERDARRMVDILFATSPFKERRRDFNVWGLVPAAAESGISRPSTGIHRASPIGTTYDAFGSERYVLTFNNRAMREIAAFAPYEFIEILTNTRTYGGGGIFNLYSTVAADSAQAPYVFVHEFAHHFAALADEYYTSPVAYAPAPARRDRAVGAERHGAPRSEDAQVARPGGTGHTAADPVAERGVREGVARVSGARARRFAPTIAPKKKWRRCFARTARSKSKLFAKEKYAGKVGAFEGANYEAKGYFRPEVDCIMFTRSPTFCAVCRRALETVIGLYVSR